MYIRRKEDINEYLLGFEEWDDNENDDEENEEGEEDLDILDFYDDDVKEVYDKMMWVRNT